MKKRLMIIPLGLSTVLALSSCDSYQSKDLVPNGSRLDVSISYDGNHGYVDMGKFPFCNTVENVNYVTGDLLPAWRAVGKKLNVNIKNAFMHGSSRATVNYEIDKSNGFKSRVDEAEQIDLYYNSISNINRMGAAGYAVDLMPYIDAGYMPNLRRFLINNEAIAKQMIVDGKLYYTPYMDGYNVPSRAIQMDGTVVKRVLDGTPSFDETTTSITAKFSPFVGDDDSNYANDTKINVSVNGQAKEVTVKKTTNIIAEQNKLLNAGTTGKALGNQFVSYLQTAYADAIAKGYITKLSDIFLSEAACYNTDDLIALMRVVKANPNLVSEGNCPDGKNVYPLIIREQATARVNQIYNWMGDVFGIQGMSSAYNFNYYAADGKMYDATTTTATYEGLDLMAQLYEEGLIQTDFWKKSSSVTTSYAQAYFGRTVKDNLGYALMEYDATVTQSRYNALDDTMIGTKPSKLVSPNEGGTAVTQCELQPILAPLTYWATESYDHNVSLTSRTGKTLNRYYEENRTLKADSWCIPAASDNILAAVALMDYVLSEEGQILMTYGPEEYWAKNTDGTYAKVTFGGQTTVQLSNATLNMFSVTGVDFWNFCRDYIGTNDAIGYIRPNTIDYQATNGFARGGAMSLSNAIDSGVQLTCTNKSEYKFGECVPVGNYVTVNNEIKNSYAAITAFWSNALNTTAYGWAKYICDSTRATAVLGKDATDCDYTFTTVKNEFTVKDSIYLYLITQGIKDRMNIDAIPEYLLG